VWLFVLIYTMHDEARLLVTIALNNSFEFTTAMTKTTVWASFVVRRSH